MGQSRVPHFCDAAAAYEAFEETACILVAAETMGAPSMASCPYTHKLGPSMCESQPTRSRKRGLDVIQQLSPVQRQHEPDRNRYN